MPGTALTPPAVAASLRRPAGLDAPRPGMLRLVRLELRKAVDTRSGRVLLAVVLLLALAGLAWRLYNVDDTTVSFVHFHGSAMMGVQTVLPVVGIMAMTAEWTQRTALSTFTTTPRRGRVLTAKLASALLLGVAVTLLVSALTALAVLVGGALTGTDPQWADTGDRVLGATLANTLNLLMAAAIGTLVPLTAGAVAVFLVAPTLWSAAAPAVLGESAQWLNVFETFARVMYLDWSDGAQTLTSLTAWIVVPLVAGVVLSLRREVK